VEERDEKERKREAMMIARRAFDLLSQPREWEKTL